MAIGFRGLTPDEFKMGLFQADLSPQCQSWEPWSKLISDAALSCQAEGYAQQFIDGYRPYVDAGDRVGLSDKICGDQLDNYILGSFAIYLMGVPPQLPVIAYAAGNKQSFEGWHGEIANLRALILFGYDVDAAIEDGRTALHLMSSLRWGKGVHLRAIKALLEAGANPNIRNVVGDSAFTFLCGSFPWTSEAHEAALMMLEHGADAHLPADDGSTGVSLLRANQAAKDQSLARQALIEMIELRHATGPGEAVPRTAPRL